MATTTSALTEEYGDLVAIAKSGSHVAHCVSADFAIGAGVAKQLDVAFDIKSEVRRDVPHELRRIGNVIGVRRRVSEAQNSIIWIFNLVTKASARDKPTYYDFETAASRLRDACVREKISELSIPRMGCGIDKLEWSRVRKILSETFENSGVSLRVYQFDVRRSGAPPPHQPQRRDDSLPPTAISDGRFDHRT